MKPIRRLLMKISLNGPFALPFFDHRAFVVELFTFTGGYFYFDKSFFEIHGKGNESEPLFLGNRFELGDLPFVEEELSIPLFCVVEEVTEPVGGNRCIFEDDTSIGNEDIGILEASPMVAQGFDFCSQENDTRFPGIEDLILEGGSSIGYQIRFIAFLHISTSK